MNQFNCIGNLVKDPVSINTPSGLVIVNGSIAINDRQKVGDEYKNVPLFMDFTMFGKIAEQAVAQLHKGDSIYISGRLQEDKWEDSQTGDKRSKLKVIVEKTQYLRWGKDRASAAPADDDEPPF
jgi:single-strand DNA-binding protein